MIMMAGGEGWLLLPNDFSDDLIVVKEKEREAEFFLLTSCCLMTYKIECCGLFSNKYFY